MPITIPAPNRLSVSKGLVTGLKEIDLPVNAFRYGRTSHAAKAAIITAIKASKIVSPIN
jgi:hypothetical protein